MIFFNEHGQKFIQLGLSSRRHFSEENHSNTGLSPLNWTVFNNKNEIADRSGQKSLQDPRKQITVEPFPVINVQFAPQIVERPNGISEH